MSWQLGHWWPLKEWFQWSAGGTTSRLRSCERNTNGGYSFKKLDGKKMETVVVYKEVEGLPWWAKVVNLPSNAGNKSLIPGPVTKIPHATGQLACMLQLLSPPTLELVLCNQRRLTHHSEEAMHQDKDPAQTKKKKKKKSKKKVEGRLLRLRKTLKIKSLISLKGPQTEESSVSR